MKSPAKASTDIPFHHTFRLLALNRVLLGIGSLAAPEAMARVTGTNGSGELTFMTRVYGSRAIAMGLGYLTSRPGDEARHQRVGLAVDISDTVAGLHHLVRRDASPRSIAMMLALSGSYVVLGGFRLAAELRPPVPAA